MHTGSSLRQHLKTRNGETAEDRAWVWGEEGACRCWCWCLALASAIAVAFTGTCLLLLAETGAVTVSGAFC